MNTRKLTLALALFAVFAFVALSLTGCDDDSSGGATPPSDWGKYKGTWTAGGSDIIVIDNSTFKIVTPGSFYGTDFDDHFAINQWEAVENTGGSKTDYPYGYKLTGKVTFAGAEVKTTPERANRTITYVYLHKDGTKLGWAYANNIVMKDWYKK